MQVEREIRGTETLDPAIFAAIQQNGGVKAYMLHPDDPMKPILEQKEEQERIRKLTQRNNPQPIQHINEVIPETIQPYTIEYCKDKITDMYNWLFKENLQEAKELLKSLSTKQIIDINSTIQCFNNHNVILTIVFKSFDNGKNFLPIDKKTKIVLDYSPITNNQDVILDELITRCKKNNQETFNQVQVYHVKEKKSIKKMVGYNKFGSPVIEDENLKKIAEKTDEELLNQDDVTIELSEDAKKWMEEQQRLIASEEKVFKVVK